MGPGSRPRAQTTCAAAREACGDFFRLILGSRGDRVRNLCGLTLPIAYMSENTSNMDVPDSFR